MGVWAHGVFDNDEACDFIRTVLTELEAVVEDGLRVGVSKRRKKFRARLVKADALTLHGPVIPAVAAIRAILAGVEAARVCVGKEKVERWRQAYFEWDEREFVPANGPSKVYRRNVNKEFDQLLRLAEGDDADYGAAEAE
jgi:hypothetical protein